jgi:hypothetical protein
MLVYAKLHLPTTLSIYHINKAGYHGIVIMNNILNDILIDILMDITNMKNITAIM